MTFPQRLRWAGWLLLFNASMAALIGLLYFKWMPLPESILGWLYLVLTLPSHYWLLSVLTGSFLLLLALIPWPRTLALLAALYSSITIVLLVVDTMVFDQYRFHINAFVIDFLLNDPDGQIIHFPLIMWIIVFAGLLLLVIIMYGISLFLQDLVTRSQRRSRKWHFFLFLALLGSHGIHVWADAQFLRDVTQQPRFYPLMQAATAQRFMEKHGWIDAEARDRAELLGTPGKAKDIMYPKNPLECTAPEKQYNILMVVIDSWRFDMLNESITPNIHRLAESHGIQFTQHYSGSNSTRGGIFSLLYGLPATYWGPFLSNTIPSLLITTLQQQDYAMGIFASARLGKPEFDRTAFATISDLRMGSQGSSPAERDQNLTNDWLEWIERHQAQGNAEPFFGFLFYDAPHGYDFPSDYPVPFTPSWEEVNYLLLRQGFNPEPFINRYKNSVHFNDTLVGEVLDDLQRRNLLDNTIVIITGDHGQEFNDLGKNYWGHNSNFSRYQIQTPLVIAIPGQKPHQSNGLTTHHDMVPTILSQWLGCQNPAGDYSFGVNLLEKTSGNHQWIVAASYIEFALMDKNRILAVNHSGGYTLLDREYNEVKGEGMPSWVPQAMRELSQFYRQ